MVSDTLCPQCGCSLGNAHFCSYCLLQVGLDELSPLSSTTGFSSTTVRGDLHNSFERAGVLQKFGDYELIEEIARGGMGVVYRARQKSLNRLVAVKLLVAGQLATPQSLERFRLEAEAAARLNHPGIVPIYEIGEHETQHFFSMELIDGVSLSECLPELALAVDAPLKVLRQQQLDIAHLIAQVARALEFAHQHGVLHRDLKPSNILIDREGVPHLTDFGLAKLTGSETSGLTMSHAILGTPGYVAPEQAAGKMEVTIAADVYGLGATLYELLTRRPPFVGANAIDTMLMALHQTPTSPRQINRSIDRDLETVVLRCLEKEPEQRFTSVAQLAEELERFGRHEPIRTRPTKLSAKLRKWCYRKPALASLTASLILALMMGTCLVLWQWSRAEKANIVLTQTVDNLEWRVIDDMLKSNQASRSLAKVARLVRDRPQNWKAAMFGMSLMDHLRFAVPAALPIRHPDAAGLNVARLSPNGLTIVTASLDQTARLWHRESSQPVCPPLQHKGPVNWAEFSPDSASLLTCSEDKTARLWRVADGMPIYDPFVENGSVTRAYFSGDGHYFLTQTANTVCLYNTATGQRQMDPITVTGRVAKTGFSVDSERFFVAHLNGNDSAVRSWNHGTGELLWSMKTGNFADAALDGEFKTLALSSETRVKIWNTQSQEKIGEFESDNGLMDRLTFSPDGKSICGIGANQWARVWDVNSSLPLTAPLQHYFLLNGASFLDNGGRVMTWAYDSLVQIWDAHTGTPYVEAIKHPNRVAYAESGHIDQNTEVYLAATSHLKSRFNSNGTGAVHLWQVHPIREVRDFSKEKHLGHDGHRLSLDGQYMAIGSTSQEIRIFDVHSGQQVCEPLKVRGAPWALDFTPDCKRLVVATASGEVTIWSIPEGKQLVEPFQLNTTYQPLAMANDGSMFATGSTDGFIRCWDVGTGKILWEKQHGSEINSVHISRDGRWMVSGGENRIACLWDARTGELIHQLRGHENEVMRVYFSPDSQSVATASLDFTARLWDVKTGSLKKVLKHQGEVLDAKFSPDGLHVATASRDRTAMLWDPSTGLPRYQGLLHEQGVRNVQFTPDSQRLVTLDFHGLRLWDVPTGHPLTVPLPQFSVGGTGFQCVSMEPNVSADGQSVLVSADSINARLWTLPVAPPTIPGWFPEFLECVAGQAYEDRSSTPVLLPAERFFEIRQHILAQPPSDFYTDWAQAWLSQL